MTHAKFSRQNFAVARGDITFHWKYSVVFMSLVFCAPELYFSCKKRKVAGTHVAIILKYISRTIIVRRSLESAKPFVNEEDKAEQYTYVKKTSVTKISRALSVV